MRSAWLARGMSAGSLTHHNYGMWCCVVFQKGRLMSITQSNLSRFSKFFYTGRYIGKFVVKQLLKIPQHRNSTTNISQGSVATHLRCAHLKCVATLPCEIFELRCSRLSYKCNEPPYKSQFSCLEHSGSKILVQWFIVIRVTDIKIFALPPRTHTMIDCICTATIKKKDITDLCSKTPLLANKIQSFAYGGGR